MVMAMHGSILSEIQVNNVVVAVVISIWHFSMSCNQGLCYVFMFGL